jgi:serine phosphatase RsbU (regulator of sigma subunit)
MNSFSLKYGIFAISLLFLSSGIIHHSAFAKTNTADSLLTLLANSKEDTVKAMLNLQLASQIEGENEYDKKLDFARKAFVLSEKAGFPKGMVISSSILSRLFESQGNFDSSRTYLFRAKNVLEKVKSKKGLAIIMGNLGTHFYMQSDMKKALDYFQKATDIFESINDTFSMASGYMNMGALLKTMGNYKDALQDYKRSEDLFRAMGKEHKCAEVMINRGIIYKQQARFDLALDEYLPAVEIAKKFNDKILLSKLYNNIGGIHLEKFEYDSALFYYDQCIALHAEASDDESLAITYSNIALIYNDQGKFDKAIVYLGKCEELAKKIKDKETLMGAYHEYSRSYAGKKEYQKAFDYVNLYSALHDTLVSDDNNKAITEMEKKFETEKKDKEILKKDIEIGKQNVEAKQQKMVRNIIILCLAIVFVVSLLVYRGYRQKKEANRIISEQKKEVEHQKMIVEEKNKEIVDSINYARRIQYALLAHDQLLKANIKYHFVFFKPKDIVSGDFYWATSKEDRFYLAVCDSTGHGVPGAFMSLLNITFLNEAITEKNIVEPHHILNHVRGRLIENISHEGGRDGMDAILLCIDKRNNKINYAAAYNSPVIVKNQQVSILEADKMPVGKGENTNSFTLHTIDVKSGDFIYLYTDGYADQFGGEKGKKFKYKELNNLLLALHQQPLEEQKKVLENTFTNWKDGLEQVDDICIVGMRI